MSKMSVFKDENGVPIKAWVEGVPFEDEAQAQLIRASKLPFLYKHIAVMSDVHSGKGCTIGSVIATQKVVVPAFTGVDIGCGMIAVKTDLKASDLPDSLAGMRSAIEQAVPHGGPGDVGSWKETPLLNGIPLAGSTSMDLFHDWVKYNNIVDKNPEIESKYVDRQFGTLGTGNHFVEVCLDETQNVWVMLHSGSRGAGNRIGTFFIEKAKEEMKRWFINLPDMDLAYLPEGSEHYDDYVEAVQWAQNYAHKSRQVMLYNTLFAMQNVLGRKINTDENTAVNCHHNYIARENHFGDNVWVTRKGAVRARTGDMGIIPGSMGARSYIVRGKGNKDSFTSCSHGAGRKMSRTQAAKTFSLADHAKATEGVECRKDVSVIDETPGAYKDIDTVMAAQSDLVEPVAILKQILCVKG
jgi:tRNA-splicing ligase RtcB